MITKLCLWTCLSLALVAIAASVVAAAFRWWDGAKFSVALAFFFGAGANLFKGQLTAWREARANDRDWRIHPKI